MTVLARLEKANALLAECQSPQDFVDVRNLAEAARVYALRFKAGTVAVNYATMVKLHAELGLAGAVDAGQAEGSISPHGGERGLSSKVGGPNLATYSAIGTTAPQVAEARLIRDNYTPEAIDELVNQANTNGQTLSRDKLLSAVRRKAKQTVDADARAVIAADAGDAGDAETWTLLAGELQKRMAEIPAGSVDLIVTDPPYPSESLPLWSDLARLAATALKPQGILVALSGQIQLPEVIRRLGEHLQYGWTYCQPLPGANNRILARHVAQTWKPWLAYSNGAWPSGAVDWHPDTLDGVKAEKAHYAWQQAGGPAGELIERLSPTGGLVLDPFAGTGTYGIVALQLGRKFIGIEADASRFAIAAERLGEA